MSVFVEQLRLAEKAAEDIYFAKLSHELIGSLHKRRQVEKTPSQSSGRPSAAARLENRPVSMNAMDKQE